jgi:tRNA A37 threonylcarbamoyladenosine dehydratase
MTHAFSRTEQLIGKAALDRLAACRVAIFGIGGVGSYVVEALARSGVGHFLLVDRDQVSLSNLNRQLIATRRTIGQLKVEAARDRILDINPEAEIDVIPVFYGPETADAVPLDRLDYIADAMDTVSAKVELAVRAHARAVPLISSMGAGNKLDPTCFQVADIYSTEVCPLSRVMRRELKKRGIPGLKVVYSREQPVLSQRIPASIAFVPSVCGLIIAGEIVKDLIAGSGTDIHDSIIYEEKDIK